MDKFMGTINTNGLGIWHYIRKIFTSLHTATSSPPFQISNRTQSIHFFLMSNNISISNWRINYLPEVLRSNPPLNYSLASLSLANMCLWLLDINITNFGDGNNWLTLGNRNGHNLSWSWCAVVVSPNFEMIL